jgi:hypothetical protein
MHRVEEIAYCERGGTWHMSMQNFPRVSISHYMFIYPLKIIKEITSFWAPPVLFSPDRRKDGWTSRCFVNRYCIILRWWISDLTKYATTVTRRVLLPFKLHTINKLCYFGCHLIVLIEFSLLIWHSLKPSTIRHTSFLQKQKKTPWVTAHVKSLRITGLYRFPNDGNNKSKISHQTGLRVLNDGLFIDTCWRMLILLHRLYGIAIRYTLP